MSWRLMAYMVVIVCLGVAMVAPEAVRAQDTRTLKISDGVVRIDGTLVPKDRLPDNLATEDIDLHFSWTGVDEPVIEIDGRFYMLGANELREAPDSYTRRREFFDALGSVGEATWYTSGYEDPATRKQVEALNVQAREMAEISNRLEHERVEDRERLAGEIRKQAEMARQMAAELPRMNVATYWDAVRESDEVLYNRLVDEYHLESKIQALAARVRGLSESGQREEAVSELKELLDRAFELKQENRRREIDQLENDLETLQVRLKEREALREKIIERRLRELIGGM